MTDLFEQAAGQASYSAKDIEVLEGLEPVRRRPGMYIGGTDDAAMHHLAAELLDNAMDEAVAGHASIIEMTLAPGNLLTVRDNGRGIPVDPHPKFRDKSALEVILTTLHSGGKFAGKAYATSGGLHGVGSSVVNALAERLEVEVAREKTLWKQDYARGKPLTKLVNAGATPNRRGTLIRFVPDPEIFGDKKFSPARLYRMCRSKAYLFRGVRIRWTCDAALIAAGADVPAQAELHFPGGLADSLAEELGAAPKLVAPVWAGQADLPDDAGRIEWACAWLEAGEATLSTYCNTIPTTLGGTHEAGFRAALLKGLRGFGEQRGNKRAAVITAEDATGALAAKLSLFIRDPQFQGQTKEKLTSPEAQKLTEAALRDRFEHFLTGDPANADNLLAFVIERAEERIRRREQKDTPRKSATRRLRLPGKLTDCSRESREDTEIFLVEGDSAGGSAKQARNRETQAVLPLRGKILNVASASTEKLRQNQELKDLIEALGCGVGDRFQIDALRYGRIIIMTDADVDGAHIASLLMTFFYRELPELIRGGHVYLAQPPLYRLTQGGKSVYAMDDGERDRLVKTAFKANAKVEISRFKGLGEMPPAILKETTMDPKRRVLLRVLAPPEARAETAEIVESLMGRKPELRFRFIQDHASSVQELDV
ncbi:MULTISPECIES: DNA topoisomerase IV subunit B [Acidiphilium]|uniref:DNA topoisomerase IV subunit B n=1 Tax=Acidiphilium TaxID=522 RepID=UPI000214589E|nr:MULTISPECIES: DNA topoisomerase IV subunit B [Acidiphilium]MBU6357118.1 DNA topoisomerase IV subunit B [Rhodospirillales bacterium]EGO94078.1 DNA gyrase subunit B [Acidiphilium sp. PM]KDM68577.1 DNA topoisomerase 4 subunit B [Acidiphilium sp. JA12-A1]MBS3023444.1 DNA topoisomerase IV subunit B [Acidiphilium multivorum]UNC14736.1 DNA topoisomerase IV subunit B [Acidiphilium multivorum]